MATLQNIRKRGPLVAIIIGFAMLAFILGDFLNSGGSLFSGNRLRIGEVDGVTIEYPEFERKMKETIELYKQRMNIPSVDERLKQQIKEQVWENMIQEIIMGNEFKELGIIVTNEELFDLVQGKNIDPIIQQIPIFTNQQTGLFDRLLVIRFLKEKMNDPTWLSLEKEVKQKHLNMKYSNLVLKGLYYTNKRVEKEFADRNYIVDFDYIATTLNDVKNDEIKISDNDIQDYYDKHEKDFEQEASRDIAYVTFKIEPSKDDSLFTKKWINKALTEFKLKTTKEDNIHEINYNSEVTFDKKHYKKDEYRNVEIDSILFNSEINAIHGPYLEDGAYKIAKLIEIKDLPDSIELKHILIQPDGTKIVDAKQAKTIADSLKTVISNGVDFAEVAKEYSTDKKSGEKGGDLGWFAEGQGLTRSMIPFDLLVDSTINEIYILEYNYGVHLIKVTNKGEVFKKIQIGVIQRKIMPSSETFQIAYSKASKFAGENRNLVNFEKSIEKEGYTKRIAPGLTQNETFIAGLESPREMIRWSFEADKNDVSEKVFEFGRNYVVAALTEIREKGIAPIEQVKQEIELNVSKEKKKEVLEAKISKHFSNDLETLASKLSKEVKEARNISFTSFQIPGIGYEPNVIANAISLEKNKASKPIIGRNGVYIIKVKSITPAPKPEVINNKAEKQKLIKDMQQTAGKQIYNTLKKSTEIIDERSKFY